ncbi:Nuclear actin-protein involved in chromatin remodeling, partial [Dimargaris xerosporica]
MANLPLAPQVYSVSEDPPTTELLQPLTDYADTYQGTNTPLVIDFGSWRCRAGWAAARPEQPALNCENAVAKYKDRRSNQAKQSVVVGDDLYADLVGRLTVKTSFDGGAICNSEPFESVLDYMLLQLGVQTDRVYHPILMTEPLCAPFYHRKLVSELLFEGYGVPSVIYGVDSLYSHYHNCPGTSSDALIISAGHTSTHLIPYVGGRALLDMSKRLTFGGNQCVEELLKLLQLKYPTFPTKITPYHASYMVHNHTYFATDYRAELQAYRDREFLTAHDRVIQFPYTVVVPETKSEEELERLANKRREQMKRMQEIAAKNRLEKLMRNEEDLDTFTKLKLGKKQDSKAVFMEKLKSVGFRNEAELDQEIKRLEASIEKAHNKDLGVDKAEEKPPHCPLLDVPDDDLSEADKKEKKKQRLLKAGFD